MNLTRSLQKFLKVNLTLEDALPTHMPVYVNSIAYLFGVVSLSALAMLILTGVVLAIFGPDWYHYSPAGHFVNSMHFWSVQIFFAGVIMHLLTKFFMAAWRGGRWLTWLVGALAFGVGMFTALTGFLSQTNWDSQWIAVQAKDAMNAAGVGQLFNTMDTGQVLMMHIVLLPLILTFLVGIHIYQIRHDSPVKPLPRNEKKKAIK
jgi:quinol-cytochrome oxidoreductase complex cytochrome b subunit